MDSVQGNLSPPSYAQAMATGNNSASSDANSVSAGKSTTSVPSNTSLNERKCRVLNAQERCELTVNGIDIRNNHEALTALAYQLLETTSTEQELYYKILCVLGLEEPPTDRLNSRINLMVEGLWSQKGVHFAAILIASYFQSHP